MQSIMMYVLPRKSSLVDILAFSLLLLLITWKLTGFLAEEKATTRVKWDGEKRCRKVLEQIKWIKTHPKDKASKLKFYSFLHK